MEDCDCDYHEIEREFGTLVATIVLELTSDPIKLKELGKHEYLKQKMVGMSKYAFVLKLVDWYSNILDKPGEKYIVNTRKLMTHLLNNRLDITERQIRIINDILLELRD